LNTNAEGVAGDVQGKLLLPPPALREWPSPLQVEAEDDAVRANARNQRLQLVRTGQGLQRSHDSAGTRLQQSLGRGPIARAGVDEDAESRSAQLHDTMQVRCGSRERVEIREVQLRQSERVPNGVRNTEWGRVLRKAANDRLIAASLAADAADDDSSFQVDNRDQSGEGHQCEVDRVRNDQREAGEDGDNVEWPRLFCNTARQILVSGREVSPRTPDVLPYGLSEFSGNDMMMTRSFRSLLLCLTMSLLPVLTAVHADDPSSAPVKPLKVLLITGGCCHDYTAQKSIIAQGLWERAHIDVEVVQQGGTATNSKIEVYDDPNWADAYDVIIHDECFSDVTDTAYVDGILKPHREGKPAVVLHCAMHCYRDGRDDWFRFCGVTSRRHGAHYAHEVLNRDAEHPIMANFPAGWANPAGELYWIEKVWDTAHPLGSAKNRELGNEEVCIWTNQFEKCRVFGTTLGHHNATVEDPVYLDMLTRGVLWAADKLDDPQYLKVADGKPKLVPVNLALGATATASSEETGKNNLAPHVNDGQPGTRWCANGPDTPQWIELDLGEPRHLTGAAIKWESDSSRYRYTIGVSTDSAVFTTVVDESKEGRNGKHEFTFDVPDARYVRVECHGADTGAWASIWELQLHGDEMIEVDPLEAQKLADAAVLSDVKVAEGFDISLFAAPPAVKYPVYVAAAPDGTLYVSVDQNGSLDREANRGAVYRLRDIDGDGRADEVKLFVTNVDSPRGLVWDHDRLYLMHPPHLSAFIDHDGDGISDEQQLLVRNIAFGFEDRPADHTSNGVTLGIDGWLYLAIGDFGFQEATDAEGTKLQFRSGGVVRVRPDGTGLEVYSRGTRNIMEVALDPLLNGFTRDNTNDGGGWDIRLHHFSGFEQHGYPSLYMNFGDEIVQPLADYGGGSGCGALYLDEPDFPEGYGNALYTADWGRNAIYRHQLSPNGATFTADQTEFLTSTRVTDLDVDGNGNLYVTSWKGATFNYAGEEVGYLVKVSPHLDPNAPSAPALPDFETASRDDLLDIVQGSTSHRRRLEAQRTLLRRDVTPQTLDGFLSIAENPELPIANRVAALYGLKQAGAPSGWIAELAIADVELRPLAIRALGDRYGVGTPWDADPAPLDASPVRVEAVALGLYDPVPRSRLEAAVAIARLRLIDLGGELAKRLDDPDPIVRHTVVESLIALGSSEPLFANVDANGPVDARRDGALRVLQSLHKEDVADGLLLRLMHEDDPARRRGLLTALCRINFVEGEWTGNSWGTRPDTSGPYYQPERWEASDRIEAALREALEMATGDEAAFLLTQLDRHKVRLDGTLERALAMAQADEALIPAAIGELSRSDSIPVEAISLLRRTSIDKDQPTDLRVAAAIAHLRSTDEVAYGNTFSVLLAINQREGRTAAFDTLWNALRDPRRAGSHVEWLREQVESDSSAGVWSAALLLALANHDESSPEARALAQQAIDTEWGGDAFQQLKLLTAAREINLREFEPRVRESLASDEEAVAKIAAEIAKDWNLEAMPTPAGPFLSELDKAEAIARATAEHGDVEYGKFLYEKLGCAKCHTVSKADPLRGPYLPQVAKTYKREQLAESILDPSKSIAQGFATEIFILDDGTQLTGFITSENAEEVTIRDKDAKETKIPVATIEARVKQTISVMPEGLVKDSTLSDLVSLLDYLQSIAE
jgi:putative membrane-bound dehydrogenase-like protein